MKSIKYIILCTIGISLFTACAEDNGPSIDDHFLNYEIPEIPVTQDYQVGIFYNRDDMGGTPNGYPNTKRWEILTLSDEELKNRGTDYNKLTPHVMPQSQKEGYLKPDGESNNTRMIPMIQQHVDWCIEAGSNFMILPPVGADIDKAYPNNLSKGDSIFCTMMLARSGIGGGRLDPGSKGVAGVDYVDLKELQVAYSINWNNIYELKGIKLTQNHCVEEDEKDRAAGYTGTLTRVELLLNLFRKVAYYFSDPNYYKVGGNRPLVYIKNNTGRMYSLDSEALYAKIRTAMKEVSGYDPYIMVESQDTWSSPGLYQYFYMEGRVDAVASKNMYDQSDMSRSYWYPQFINENWKYNREYILPKWGIEYIPTIGPAWNKLVQDGRNIGNTPIVEKHTDKYRTMCNVAKMNAGTSRLILIDSFNRYNFNSFIEPTIEDYGKGYGKTYLELTRQQFKKN